MNTILFSRCKALEKPMGMVLFCAIIAIAQAKSLLDPATFKHHVEKFNKMEDESVVKSIPNSKAWEWMEENMPLLNWQFLEDR